MNGKKYTKNEIVDAIYEKSGFTQNEIRELIDLFINEVKNALLRRQTIELRGFGTFEVKIRKARQKARNPRTGQTIAVSPRGTVSFRSGLELRQKAWNITDEEKGNT